MSDALDVLPAESPNGDSSRGEPWGFWATLGFSIVLALIWLGTGILGSIVGLALLDDSSLPVDELQVNFPNHPEHSASLRANATMVVLSVLGWGVVMPAFCVLFALLKPGISVRDYLALRSVTPGRLAGWSGIMLLAGCLLDSLTWLAGRQIVPQFSIDAYRSVAFLPLLWIAFVIAAPLWEEFVFRGFLFAGLRRSWLGTVGTVLVTTSLWAALHLQYDWFQVLTITILGVVLSYARIRTESLGVVLLMHAINNLVAMIQVTLYVQFWM
jgi:membrane protease YdiL (CAAX protease family)